MHSCASIAGWVCVLSIGLGACGSAAHDGAGGAGPIGSAGSTATGGSVTATGGSATATGGTMASGGSAGSSSATGGSSSACPTTHPAGGSGLGDQEPGTWKDVTPFAQLSSSGTEVIFADPARPSDMYVNADNQGVWRSTDYGLTWAHASTGDRNANSGRAWYGGIALDPCRDPATPPDLYVALGYGAGAIWKSQSFAVDWTKVWNDNIFLEDGTTNISADVGGDVHSVEIVDPKDSNHVIASLHGYWGTGDNNGVFETTNGGQSWVVRKSATFNFQPHADILFSVTPTTWMVSHGTTYPNSELYRTTDSGKTWTIVNHDVFIGRFTLHLGSTVYAQGKTLYKNTDEGATWTPVSGFGSKGAGGMWASATRIYVVAANDLYDTSAEIRWAPINDDSTWTSLTLPAGFFTQKPNDGGWTIGTALPERAAVTSDGTHTIFVTSDHNGGLWRYVEP